MTEREELSYAVKRIGIGYLFTYLSINLWTIDIFPDFVCWLFILKTLPILKKDEPSAALLKPFGTALFVYDLIIWGLNIFGIPFGLRIVAIVMKIVTIYFNFQLLTNLADIAQKYGCPQRKKLLQLRAAQAVFVTILAVPLNLHNEEANLIVGIALATAGLIIGFWICSTLFSFKRSLLNVPTEESTDELPEA